jgi:hypothetical protein
MPIRFVDRNEGGHYRLMPVGLEKIIMNRETKTGTDRLVRMRQMFAACGAILEEDYLFFTRRDEPNPRSKAPRKLAARCGRQAPERN